MNKRILVLGCDDRSGLTVIRSLGRAGCQIDIGWVTDRRVVKSRYVRNVVNLPTPDNGTDAWLDALLMLQHEKRYDLIVPCNDHAIIPIQARKDEIRKHGTVYALEDRAFVTTFNKIETTLLAARCGVNLPQWMIVQTVGDIEAAEKKFQAPLVIKPVSSFDLNHARARREVRTIIDKKEFRSALEEMVRTGPVLVQGYFVGTGVGVELLAKDGTVLAAFQHERVHEPPGGGGSSYRRSVPMSAELLNASKAIVADLRYTGIIMIEFRVNPKTKGWILIETNGRFWGSLPLSSVAGMDFPRYLCEMLLEGRKDFPLSYRKGVYCRNLTLDLRWLNQNRKANRNDPTKIVVPWRRVVAESRHALSLSEHIDTFAIDDPLPFLAEVGELAGRAGTKLAERTKRVVGLSAFLKHRRARRAAKALEQAKTAVFVCFGNICRSPFAESYARKIAPTDIIFTSAGTYWEAGRTSPAAALEAAALVGIDLSRHRSQVLSASIVEESDVIFVFDQINFKEIASRYPTARDRIVRLSNFLPGDCDEIVDPYGQPRERFDQCYKLISDSLIEINRSYWTGRGHGP